MANRDIIVIGASAGGVEALSRLVADLPGDLPATVFVTVHFPRDSHSVLPRILTRRGRLAASHPDDREPIRRGHIYVAPPDHHLLVREGVIRLVRGPTENGNRPAIDPMFRSAAITYGARVIGVVLTGTLDDGTAGLFAITRRGGVGVAQDPADALFPSMPASAIEHGVAPYVAPLAALGALLERLVHEEIDPIPEPTMRDDAGKETAYSAFDMRVIEDPEGHPGEPSPYSCPDCGGVLWAIEDERMLRFRCRVGHGWTNDGLLMQQTETLDTALWTALRALEENASLNQQMAVRAGRRGNGALAARFRANAQLAERRAGVLRDALASGRQLEPAPQSDQRDEEAAAARSH